jgi:hypothetical protein
VHASGRPRWLEVFARTEKYFGRRRQAMMAKIACRNLRSILVRLCSVIGFSILKGPESA